MGSAQTELNHASPDQAFELIARVARLTRMLREGMRELGLDDAIKDAAAAIPDARDRLRYVATMTEQAATRVLNSAEQAQAAQQSLLERARALGTKWEGASPNPDPALQAETRVFFQALSEHTHVTQRALSDIILAQDFQDLTGQVIIKMLDVVGIIETELVQVLLDSVPAERRDDAASLLNGPQVAPQGKTDVVTGQDQVDDLLSSLGL